MNPHTFSRVPTFEQLVTAAAPSMGLKIFFKGHDGKYIRVTSDSELSWTKFYQQNGMYYARLAQSTPPSSPEKGSGSGNLSLAPGCVLPGTLCCDACTPLHSLARSQKSTLRFLLAIALAIVVPNRRHLQLRRQRMIR
jgi:hypothetical protein